MNTQLFKKNQIEEAVRLLKKGEIIAVPTETVYGLAADAHNEIAINKIFKAKDRPIDHPLIVHIHAFEETEKWAEYIPPEAKILANCFWPGPVTMILKKRKSIKNIITGGSNTVAIRLPQSPLTLKIIKELGNAIVAPSANVHKKISPTTPEHVLKGLEGKIAGIVDGGKCRVGVESTIIDLTTDIPVVLRPGAITLEMIEKALKRRVHFPTHHNKKVSGNMKNHYQPEKPLFLLPLEKIEQLTNENGSIAIMHHSKISKKEGVSYYSIPVKKSAYAKVLYETLHIIENSPAKTIYVETPPNSMEWADIYDRLYKASQK